MKPEDLGPNGKLVLARALARIYKQTFTNTKGGDFEAAMVIQVEKKSGMYALRVEEALKIMQACVDGTRAKIEYFKDFTDEHIFTEIMLQLEDRKIKRSIEADQA